jgi:hypothetical protein
MSADDKPIYCPMRSVSLEEFKAEYASAPQEEPESLRVDWAGGLPQPSDDDDEHGMPMQPPRGPGLSDADLALLTLAARALGAERVEVVEGENWLNLHFADGSTMWNWNSLLHSDDTFTMMVRLRLLDEHPGFTYKLAEEQGREGADEVEAARRAATRAAAEIAKQRS